jgi:hypothetical protein
MNRLLAALALVGILLVIAFVAAQHSIAGSSQATSGIQKQFFGTWKLVSTEEVLKDGTSRPYQDVGSHGMGYLMYMADGHMCAELANPDRPNWDDPPTTAQKLAAIEGLAAYCGRFELDEANHVMWHYPEVAWKPSYAGSKQRRPYRMEGNRLTFSDKQSPEDDPTVDRWTIVWEKVK